MAAKRGRRRARRSNPIPQPADRHSPDNGEADAQTDAARLCVECGNPIRAARLRAIAGVQTCSSACAQGRARKAKAAARNAPRRRKAGALTTAG